MSDIASPCIGVCALNEAAVCIGCGRSIDEISEWPRAGSARRETVLAVARARLDALKQAEAEPSRP